MPVPTTRYRLSPAWRLSQSGQSLLVEGGADARYEIDLEAPGESLFASLTSGQEFTREDLNDPDRRVLEQLVTAEVVVPVLIAADVLRVAVGGDATSLVLPPHESIEVVPAGEPHDLLVVIRTTSTYAALLAALDYRGLATPHVLVDMAFHHTVSLGPLVFPGETACLACLEGRIGVRWGDDAPPPEPLVSTESVCFVAQVTLLELVRIARGETSLSNKTFAWDLRDRTVTNAQLLKVPLCPVCARHDESGDRVPGSISLPWSGNEALSNAI